MYLDWLNHVTCIALNILLIRKWGKQNELFYLIPLGGQISQTQIFKNINSIVIKKYLSKPWQVKTDY